jgi:glycosyltransferase involved in cell wall biosynthesis
MTSTPTGRSVHEAIPSAIDAGSRQPDHAIVIVEPLARSTGHQSWFSNRLTDALVKLGSKPRVITFDGMNDEADLRFVGLGCDVRRVYPKAPGIFRIIVAKATGISCGSMASPSAVRWPAQIGLYNRLATAITTLYATLSARRDSRPVIHLLGPPSALTLLCYALARRHDARALANTFAPPRTYRGGRALRQRLCESGALRLVVQTEALACEWRNEVGEAAVRCIPVVTDDQPVAAGDPHECRRLLSLPDDKPIIAVIGCMAPQKGYIELLRAVQGTEKRFRILLIGDTPGWVTPNPDEVAEECGWADHTIFRNRFVPDSIWPTLFGAIDAVALLYREANASSGILSFCHQYGVPVVATRFGEIGSKVHAENLGATADPANPQEVLAAIDQVLSRKRRRTSERRASGAAHKTGSELSWAEVAAAHLRLYEEVRAFARRAETPVG